MKKTRSGSHSSSTSRSSSSIAPMNTGSSWKPCTSSSGPVHARSNASSYWPTLMCAKWGASGRPIRRSTPAALASSAPSAMNGGECFIAANAGTPSRSPSAAACRRVISSSGERPIARYRPWSSASASGEGGRPPLMCVK